MVFSTLFNDLLNTTLLFFLPSREEESPKTDPKIKNFLLFINYKRIWSKAPYTTLTLSPAKAIHFDNFSSGLSQLVAHEVYSRYLPFLIIYIMSNRNHLLCTIGVKDYYFELHTLYTYLRLYF